MSSEKKAIKKLAGHLQDAHDQIEDLENSLEHAFLSPSFAHIGLYCAASAIRTFQVEQRIDLMRQVGAEFYGLSSDSDEERFNKIMEEDNEPARDGTAFHEIMEYCLTKRTSDAKVIAQRANKAVKKGNLSAKAGRDDFLLSRLRNIIIEVLEMFSEAQWIGIESRCKVKGLPEHGTLDVRALVERTLYIKDLKCGHNEVHGEENDQYKIYAIGTLDRIGWDKVDKVVLETLGLRWESEPWEISPKKLLKYKREFMLPRFMEAYSINPTATPGDHCLYCAAKIHCREWQDKFESNVNNEVFENLDLKELDTTGLVNLYTLCKQAENLAKSKLSPEILMRFEGFDDVPQGITRVTGQKILAWTKDEATVVRKLSKNVGGEDNLFKRELKTPTQVKAVLGDDKALAKFTKKVVKKPYLKLKSK